VAALLLAYAQAANSHAAVVTVNSNADSNGLCTVAIGGCTLREAINHSDPGDIIRFSGGVTGVIDLTLGELVISKNLRIEGPGSSVLRVEADGNSRILSIPGPPIVVTISGLTFRGGRADAAAGSARGGAIFNFGQLTLRDVQVISSEARGTAAGVAALGGGIYSGLDSMLTLDRVTVANNAANGGAAVMALPAGDAYGGGIYTAGRFEIERSTISSNVATGGNGPGTADGVARGGGIYVADSGLVGLAVDHIMNSTISGNRAIGGIGNQEGANSTAGGLHHNRPTGITALESSTVAFNHADYECVGLCAAFGAGGLHRQIGGLSVLRSIVAHNTIADSQRNCHSVSAALTFNSLEFSPSGFVSCPNGPGQFAYGDPLLAPLSFNGGTTRTHAIGARSAAIDAVTGGFCLTTDQRGSARALPYGGTCDIGAFETPDPNARYGSYQGQPIAPSKSARQAGGGAPAGPPTPRAP
jgi:CSLREA domain-containing protein